MMFFASRVESKNMSHKRDLVREETVGTFGNCSKDYFPKKAEKSQLGILLYLKVGNDSVYKASCLLRLPVSQFDMELYFDN